MNKNNTNKVYKLGKSIAQIVPFHRIPIKREQQRDNHNQVGNNNSNNSDSEDCCFNEFENVNPIERDELDNVGEL